MEKEQPRLNRKTEWTEQRTLSLNGTGMKGNNSFAFLPFQMGSGELPILLVFSLIFVLGVVGNSLVITVLARSKPGKPRSTTNIFILNLSIADLAYLLFCVPFQATIYVLPYWVLGAFICKFIHYFFTVSMLVSIFTLSAMSVDRYFAIVHCRRSASIRVARNALTGVIVIWILSVIMASPVPYNRVIYYSSNNLTFCWERWSNPRNKTIYVVCRFVFGYLLPLLLISFCYTKVLNHLHKNLRNISKKSEASKKKTAQTVLVVIVVFGISWLPHHVIYLWAEFGSFPLTNATFIFRIIGHCLAYSNSSVNPIIYAFLSENFRKAYKQVFKCQINNKSYINDIKKNKSQIDTPPSTNCTQL